MNEIVVLTIVALVVVVVPVLTLVVVQNRLPKPVHPVIVALREMRDSLVGMGNALNKTLEAMRQFADSLVGGRTP